MLTAFPRVTFPNSEPLIPHQWEMIVYKSVHVEIELHDLQYGQSHITSSCIQQFWDTQLREIHPPPWDEAKEVKKPLWRVSYVIITADSNV